MHTRRRAWARARTVDSELNVHLSQVYSCCFELDGARRCDFYDYLQFFSSPLSLTTSLSLCEWCFVCGQRALCTQWLNRPFTCTCTCTLALIYAQLIVVVAAAAVAVWFFLSFHLLFWLACIAYNALLCSLLWHNKTMRDDGKQWRSFTMRSAQTHIITMGVRVRVRVCLSVCDHYIHFSTRSSTKVIYCHARIKSNNFGGSRRFLSPHSFSFAFITIMHACWNAQENIIKSNTEHQKPMAFPCFFSISSQIKFGRIYGILNTANSPSKQQEENTSSRTSGVCAVL